MSTLFRGRRAASIENAALRVTVLEGGGHIAEVFDKRAGVNPLWIPPWPSIEPAEYVAADDRTYGRSVESQLLAGIMGHNLCIDIFGGPSAEEEAAGLQPHGEASVVPYRIDASSTGMTMAATLVQAQLAIERRITLDGPAIRVVEIVENMTATDRPIAWTEHVTLGPPFLENGVTQFRSTATRSKVFESTFGAADYLVPGAEFRWPDAPRLDGGRTDLQTYTSAGMSGAYTAHLMDAGREDAWFVAFSPTVQLAFGYVWRRADFPWLGIWEENRSRSHLPWNGGTVTRGMEFGVSPFPESRREMIERGRMFDTPCYRWIPARTRVQVEYWIVSQLCERIPDSLAWPGANS